MLEYTTEELKELLPQYLEMLVDQGVIEYKGNDFYDCPYCGSGTNMNQTAAFHVYDEGTKFKCFSCGVKGDIIDLVSHIEKLEKAPFWQKKKKVEQIMKKFLEMSVTKVPVLKPGYEENKMEDYSGYINACCKRAGETEYFKERGLSKETIEKFCLGYDPEKKLVTIPYNPESKGYIHRILFDGNTKYVKHGTNEIFNVKALYNNDTVFVTEGQMDCMSFEEIGFPAIGLGGTNETDKLISVIKEEKLKKRLIIALDNDVAGKKASARLMDGLADTECEYLVCSELYGAYKDANEFLVLSREKFIERINDMLFMTNG